MKNLFRYLLLLGCFATPWAQQERARKKPVLIRADRTSKPEVEIITPDPFEAQRNLQVGDFYFKRRNYQAAAERYRQAIQYAPKSPPSYFKLIRALEKLNQISEAHQVCRQFIDENPESEKVKEFQKKAEALQAQAGDPSS